MNESHHKGGIVVFFGYFLVIKSPTTSFELGFRFLAYLIISGDMSIPSGIISACLNISSVYPTAQPMSKTFDPRLQAFYEMGEGILRDRAKRFNAILILNSKKIVGLSMQIGKRVFHSFIQGLFPILTLVPSKYLSRIRFPGFYGAR